MKGPRVSIFKSCDIRGVYNEELTDATMADIGRGMAAIMRRAHERPAIVVGGDTRRSTAPLKAALVAAMAESGVDVLDIGIAPTPVFYFAFRSLPAHGCAMVTASHNPPQFNGLKLCFSQMPVTLAEIAELELTVGERRFVTGVGSVRRLDVLPDYEGWLGAQFPAAAPRMKMACDAGGGAWSNIAPRLLRAAGFDVEAVFCRVDADFAARDPNPLPEALGEVRRAVVAAGCRFGAAFDGDGDRVVFVDEQGAVIASDVAGAVIARRLLEAEPGGKVVYEVNCSQALPDAVAAAGGVPLIERAGHAFMKRRMIDEQALFGAEISGHFFYRSLGGGDDGLYSALAMGKLLQQAGRPLSALAGEVPRYHATPVVRLPRRPADAQRIVDGIAANARGGTVSRIDGIRIQYDDGWALARVSVTEPVVSLRFEARRRELLPGILQRFLGFDPALLAEVKARLRIWRQDTRETS